MPARRALATIAAVTLGATAIGAAVGATTRVFNVAEASPGVGKVSPVSTSTLPPIVEHHVIDVEDAVTVPPVPVPGPATATATGSTRPRTSTSTSAVVPTGPGGTPNAVTVPTPAPTVAPHHEVELRGEDD